MRYLFLILTFFICAGLKTSDSPVTSPVKENTRSPVTSSTGDILIDSPTTSSMTWGSGEIVSWSDGTLTRWSD